MRTPKAVEVFHDRYPLLGPLLWVLSVHYFVVQLLVALAWSTPFSLRANTISDLGNTACGSYRNLAVCSPLHSVMNASFLLLGVIMMSGSLLIYQEFKESKGTLVGFSLMALAGFGTCLVGLFPENTVSALHILGASLPFLFGNLSLVILGWSLYAIPKGMRYYTLLSGIIPLIALCFYATDHYGPLEIGGLERLVAYPQTIWLFVFGLYMSHNRFHRP